MKKREYRAAHKPGDFSLGQIYEFCAEFGRLGGSPELIQNLIEDKQKMTKVVSLAWKNETSEKDSHFWGQYCWLGRVILGRDFISPKEVARTLSIDYTDNELNHLQKTLPDERILHWYRNNGYLLIAGPPRDLNLLEIQKFQKKIIHYGECHPWLFIEDNEEFPKSDTVKANRWIAIKKQAYSFDKTWEEQQKVIPKTDYIPNVAEVSFAFITYYRVRGVHLLNDCYVRTSSISTNNNSGITAGYFHKNIFCINRAWAGRKSETVGILSSSPTV